MTRAAILPFRGMLAALALVWAGCAESQSSSSSASRSSDTGPVAFTEVTSEAGLDDFRHATGAFGEKWFPETMGSGGGFIDYNGDGWLDILLVGGGSWSQSDKALKRALWLYRNNQDGTFTLRTEEAGLDDASTYGFGVTVADYDNDGDEDFYLTALRENLLFRNDGGSFTEIGQEAGAAGPPMWSTAAIFFDADRDGHLDLYVGNYVEWSPENDFSCTSDGGQKAYCRPGMYKGISGRFYRSDGDGTFTDRTEEAGFLPAPGKTLGVAALDANADGWPDLLVANDQERNLLYENDGDGTFTEQGMLSGIAFNEDGKVRGGMGADAGVVDSTGQPTIFVGNFSREMIGVYRHMKEGLFADRAVLSKIGSPSFLTLTFGLFLFDVDLDGDLDLFVANGHVQEVADEMRDGITYRQPSQLFLNHGGGTFEEASTGPGSVLAEPMVARGAAHGDYDRDGDLDILITENDGPAHLWHNDLAGGHFLRVRLVGQESNRDGIGARVVAVVGDRRMVRRIHTGSSYLSQSETVATFGLGEAKRVDSLLVYWPSGQTDRFTEVKADQVVRVVEGQEKLRPQTAPGQEMTAERTTAVREAEGVTEP